MKLSGHRLVALFTAFAIVLFLEARAQAPSAISVPQLTAKRIHETGWWPTRQDAARSEYSGTEVCAGCHEQEAASQQQTSMAKAASRAQDTEILRSNATISLDNPPFHTTILRERKGSSYSLERGGESVRGEITWAMGNGNLGRTFILESNGSLFESQLSYYTAIRGLDLTPGHKNAGPADLMQAFGEQLGTETSQFCFGCHTTASMLKGKFDPTHATPGVTCEACHGPGARHVNAMGLGQIDEGKASILNPASFDPVKLVDYCGACHRAPLDVPAAKAFLPTNVRFQPYRLAKSRCWRRPDRRITCIACHNPHEEVVRDISSYDVKCLSCHTVKTAKADQQSAPEESSRVGEQPACPISSRNCASCHMPKYNVPQMHGSFTDHYIRIVREGEPYPL